MSLFKSLKSLTLTKGAVQCLAFSSVISVAYARGDAYVLDLKKAHINREELSLEEIAELSEGRIVEKDGHFALKEAIQVRSEIPLKFSQELLISEWDLTVDCTKIKFENFVIRSFEDFDVEKSSKAAGNVLFLNTQKDSAGEETRMRLSGSLKSILRGQGDKDGGSIQFPANAEFDLDIAHDLSSGAEGGDNGLLIYSLLGTKLDRESAYPYEPDGIHSRNLSLARLFFESAAL